jgi:hypothetical protein
MRHNFSLKGGLGILLLVLTGCMKKPVSNTHLVVPRWCLTADPILKKCGDLENPESCKLTVLKFTAGCVKVEVNGK